MSEISSGTLEEKFHIPKQPCTLYFASYINTLLTRSRLYSRFKKKARCHSFMSLNRESDVSAADWPSQTHVKNYRNLSCAETRFLPVVEIRTEHSWKSAQSILLYIFVLDLFLSRNVLLTPIHPLNTWGLTLE